MKARAVALALVLALAALVAPAAASAAPSMEATFSPNRLGANTTIAIGFDVGSNSSPLVGLEMDLPRGVTAGFTTLGLATCDASLLEARGGSACPRNSLVGRGRALVSVPVGSEQVFEPLAISIFMAPAEDSRTTMLFYVEGTDPVITQLVFHGSLVGADPPFDGLIDTEIPEVTGLPGSSPATFVSMRTELAPKGLLYAKQEHGKTVTFTPEGFDVPTTCPAGGFPFAATLTFADGTREKATTRVSCPRPRSGRPRK
jgi:hypothetical protein